MKYILVLMVTISVFFSGWLAKPEKIVEKKIPCICPKIDVGKMCDNFFVEYSAQMRNQVLEEQFQLREKLKYYESGFKDGVNKYHPTY